MGNTRLHHRGLWHPIVIDAPQIQILEVTNARME
jgi:hypothetical protein